MSSNPKKPSCKLKKAIKTSCGCGESSTQVVEPKPKPSIIPPSSSSSLSSTIVMHREEEEVEVLCPQMVTRSPKLSGSVAVVKDSDDPCADFRRSMLHMILNKGIYLEEDLQELLKCFLQMNPPSLHQIIIQAFTNILSDIYLVSNKI